MRRHPRPGGSGAGALGYAVGDAAAPARGTRRHRRPGARADSAPGRSAQRRFPAAAEGAAGAASKIPRAAKRSPSGAPRCFLHRYRGIPSS